MARLGQGIGLVGRRREVSTLVAALDRAARGSAAGVVVSGDAGVGKSRLVAETVERATAHDFTVLVGRCLDTAESALPYLPFTEVIGTLAALRPELVAERDALRHLLPGVHRRAHEHPDLRPPEHDLGQLRVFDAVLSVLDELSARTPVLLVVEDLHWADRSSRDLLVFLLSRLTGQRIVLLATYRSDDLHRRHPLRPVLSELVRLPAVERVELEPLDTAESLQLVRLLADGGMPDALARNIAERSEGNAFFAEELVSASTDRLPHGLAEVLLARVEGLAAATQRLLRIAAVAGRKVRHDRLAEVAGLDVDTLEQALRDAVTHHVLVPATEHDGYAFRHALLREAIYRELLPGERSRLHAAYAALLAEENGDGDETGVSAALAHHAMAGHNLPLALAASVRAAREADDREAPAELLFHAGRALEIWSAVPDAETVAGIDESRLTRWASWGASAAGDLTRGVALAERAVQLAEEKGDVAEIAYATRRYAMRLYEVEDRVQDAVPAARRALALTEALPQSVHHAWGHAVLARSLMRVDRFEEATVEAERAIAVADDLRGLGDVDERDVLGATSDALVTLAVCQEYGGNPQRARHLLAEAKPLARKAENLGVELRAYYAVGISLLDEGRLAEAAEEFTEGGLRANATGTTWSAYGLELRVAQVIVRFMAGEWAQACAAARIAGEAVPVAVASRLTAAGLLVTVAQGDFESAGRRIDELGTITTNDDQAIMLVGQASAEMALWRASPREAEEAVRHALNALASSYWGGLGPHLGGIMLAAIGIAAQADLVADGAPRELATAAARELMATADYAAEHGMPRAGTLGPEALAWLRRGRAELTRVAGRPDPQAWTDVVDAFAYEGADDETDGYRQAHARMRRAEALLESGAPHAQVADDLHAADATARALGAEPLRAAVIALAGRAGIRLGAPEPPRASTDPLTPRERSVLRLVAEGLTNRQVGAELFISEKTVSVHLSRVMAKLGAGSRTEAVSVAFARGLLAPQDRGRQ